MEGDEKMKDYSSIASSLYDGGWRVCDKALMIDQFGLTENEANEICRYFKLYGPEEEEWDDE